MIWKRGRMPGVVGHVSEERGKEEDSERGAIEPHYLSRPGSTIELRNDGVWQQGLV